MDRLYLFSLFMLAFSLLGFGASMVLSRRSRYVYDRVRAITQRSTVSVPDESTKTLTASFGKRFFYAVRWARSRFGITEDDELVERFVSAGLRSSGARDIYFAGRMASPVLAILAGCLAPTHKFSWVIALGGIFYIAPNSILQILTRRRRDKTRRSIPDAIDLLVICVDAGLGMDQAMMRVGQELATSHPQIYEEFMQINREQRAGKVRLEAWKGMADRCQLPEIDGFVDMLMQTERFGTPIARALSQYGDSIRQKRRQRAEELAAKTTVKIIFPLVLCIFPSLFIVLLGPAGITISHGLSLSTH